jgi:glycosyltransferase involved in cell wall biosynthesis
MKIGLIIYGSLDTISGGYLYDRKLVEYLQRQGDTVQIVSLQQRNYLRCLVDSFSPTLRRRLQALDVEALFQDELNHPSLFWLNRYLNHGPARIAVVHHLRMSEQFPAWQKRLYAEIERRYLQSVDGFVFNSLTTAAVVNDLLADHNQVKELAGIHDQSAPSDQRVQAPIPSAAKRMNSVIGLPAGDRFDPQITDEEIEVRASLKGPLRIVFLGNLIARKGLHTLLAALALLSPGTAELAVIGSPAPEPVYARRMQRLVVRSRAEQTDLAVCVRFLGVLDDPSLAAQLRRSHVLAVPSSYEGYGIVYLEGMSFGLPAIAGATGAAREIITPEKNGFLVQADDAAAIAAIIAALAADRSRLLELSLAARRRYLAQPTWDQTAASIRDFLLKLVNPPQRSWITDHSLR